MSQHNSTKRSLVSPLSRSKRGDGQGVPLLAIMFLVLSVSSLILAGFVIGKFWKAVIGTDASEQDATILANAISELLANDKQYDTRIVYLRLEENTLIGFQPYIDGVEGAGFIRMPDDPRNPTVTTNIEQPDDCVNKGCICRLKDQKAADCANLQWTRKKGDADHINGIVLVSAYEGSAFRPPEKDVTIGPASDPFVIPATQYYEFAANIHYTDIEQAGPGGTDEDTKAQTTKAILPVLVEKVIHPSEPLKVYIILHPVTPKARARWYTYEICTNEDGACQGKTAFKSQYDFKTGLQKDQYCRPTSAGTCDVIELQVCQRGEVYEPCLCNGQPVTYGFCFTTFWSWTQCSTDITECSDYCKSNLGAPNGEFCQEEEAVVCLENPCEANIQSLCRPIRDDAGRINCERVATAEDQQTQRQIVREAQEQRDDDAGR